MHHLNRYSIFRAGAGALALACAFARPVAAQWSTNPALNTPVCTSASSQLKSVAVSDGAGGVIVAWADNRSATTPADIYAQRFDAAGNAMWAPASGVVICTAGGDQDNPAITSDNAGGAIISWDDFRAAALLPPPPGASWDIYAQHVDAGGVVRWAIDGVLAGAVPPPFFGAQQDDIWSMLVPDGVGGAIVAWESGPPAPGIAYDIYAQRLGAATGAPQWAPLGVPICTAIGGQWMPMLVRSGTGAIITWYDSRGPTLANPAGAGLDIYAQRVNAVGAVQWAVDGVAVYAGAADQQQPSIASDGADGAIVTWYDSRNGGANLDVYAQHINVGGVRLWPGIGLPICTAPVSNQQWPKIVSDDAGGAIIAWYDARAGANDIYAQRVTGTGLFPWGIPDGVPVCVAAGNQDRAKIVSDGGGGAIVAWRDARLGGTDIYAQRLDAATGAPRWALNGVAVSTAALGQDWWDQQAPVIADGNGGAIITWTDSRVGPPLLPPTDIYAQRLNDDGTLGGAGIVKLVTLASSPGSAAAVAAAGSDGSAVLTFRTDVVRFDANGDPQWARAYEPAGDESLNGTSIARMPDGWVTSGNFYNPGTAQTHGAVMRLNEAGDVLWALRAADFSQCQEVIRASDGGIVITGWSVVSLAGGPIDAHAFLTRFDANGNRTWTTMLNSTIANSRPDALIELANGGFVVAGTSWMNPYERLFIARFGAIGNLAWARAFTVESQSAAGPVSLSPMADGGFVLGSAMMLSGTATLSSRLMLARFDANGNPLWTNAMDDASPIYRAVGVSADATGEYLCAALNPGAQLPQSDAAVIRASSTGTFEWLRRMGRAGNFWVASGVAPVAGGVLVAGGIAGEYMLAKVTASGQTCLGTLEVPTTTGISLASVDPLLTSLPGTPTFNAFSPPGSTLSSAVDNCTVPGPPPPPPPPTAVPAGAGPVAGNPRAIGVRVTTPASDQMTCLLALPRSLALRGQWFDLLGRHVGGAFELGELPAGDHTIRLARPDVGNGIYVLQVSGGGLQGAAKAVFLR